MENLWLPYHNYGLGITPLEVESAEGCRIKLKDGRELIDGIANWWTVCHGHRHPALVKALSDQAKKLPHIMLGGMVHEQATKLSARLANMTQLHKVFFSDSGSTAVEVALKMAVQYWRNKNKNSKKQKFLYFTNSYHGDTMGAMSVSDGSVIHSAFAGFMPLQYMVDIPSDELGFQDFEALLTAHSTQLAGVIIEPLVQMAGGFKFHSADTLAEIYRLCKKHNTLFIADEIATGFGRTGYMFACEEAGIVPDIMCLGKALTGGMIGMAATCASKEIFDSFKDSAFMHGPTYMANPLACAAANASLDLFEREPRLEQVAHIEAKLLELLSACRSLPTVKDVRVKGAIGVVQLNISTTSDDEDTPLYIELRKKFLEAGVHIRPFGDVVYLCPPFTISDNELKTLADSVYSTIKALT